MNAKSRADTALDKSLQTLKDMGVTITSKPAAGREADFNERPLGILQAAADRLGMGGE